MNSIPFCFGEKHRDYMRRCLGASVCVAEGAVRSGKTVDHVFVFAKLLEDAPDRLHLATGPTLANARLNIGSCNGFGLAAEKPTVFERSEGIPTGCGLPPRSIFIMTA